MENKWISVKDKMPEFFETVWLSNKKGFVCLGCLVYDNEGTHWSESNGIIWSENGKIISECESEDLEVDFWCSLPKLPL